MEFPQEIRNRFEKKIKQSVKMVFYDGAIVNIDGFNLAFLQPYRAVFTRKSKVVLVFITEDTIAKKYHFFANVIVKESEHSFNETINLINANL